VLLGPLVWKNWSLSIDLSKSAFTVPLAPHAPSLS
jgi:hypothetical protein